MSDSWRDEFVTKGAAFKVVENKMESLLKQFGYGSYEEADEKIKLAYDGMMDALTAIYGMPPSVQQNDIQVAATNYANGFTDGYNEGKCDAQQEQSTEVQDILQYLDKYLHPIVSPEHWSVYSMLYDMVSMLPPTQSLRKKGRWIDDGLYSDNFPHHIWRCSECGESVIEIDTPWFKFCPSCGADMRGKENARI